MKENLTTQSKIINCAKSEFLSYGFKDASLRTIVKNAGVTTGAFYGYYKNKEELFAAIVENHAKNIIQITIDHQSKFSSLSPNDQKSHIGEISSEGLHEIVEYIYNHFDEVKILICGSHGTKYESFISDMIEIELKASDQFIDTISNINHRPMPLDRQLIYMIISTFFTGFMDIVVRDMSKSDALIYSETLQAFYTAGWKKIIEL